MDQIVRLKLGAFLLALSLSNLVSCICFVVEF